MKRVLTFLLVCLAIVTSLNAQPYLMTVHLKNGQKHEIMVDSIQEITFAAIKDDSYKQAQEESVVKMRYGVLVEGYPEKGVAEERWESSYSKLIKVEGTVFQTPFEGEVRCCLYDSSFVFIKESIDLEEINAAYYIRFVRKEDEPNGPSDVIISHTGKIKFINEPTLNVLKNFSPTWFTVDVNLPYSNPSLGWVEGERLYTNSWISLPWNYRSEGEKNKLIVYGTGTTGAKCNTITDGAEEKVNYFNAMGYAVLVVNCNTNKFKTNRRNNCATPLGVACFTAAIRYVIDNYNMDSNFYIYVMPLPFIVQI